MILDGYIRVSQVNGREGERFISPQMQRDQIEGYARLHGHRLGLVFEEMDQSGGRADRPLLLQALARQESGEAQVLCVAKLDRFGRSLVDGLSAIERVTDAGGSFVSVADNLDFSSPTGRLLLRLMLSLAEWELERVKNTWAEAQRRAIARGVFTGSSVPLGYRRLKSGRLVIDRRTAPLVRELFVRRMRGEPVQDLADYLTGRVPTPTGKRVWSHNTVRTLVRRRTYLGEVSYRDHRNPHAHQPLVDAVTWQAAQLQPQAGPGPRRIEPALLHGLLRCAGCSRVMMTRCDEHNRLIYVCPQGTKGSCPAHTYIYGSKAEPYMEAATWGEVKGDSARRQRSALARAEERLDTASQALEAYRDHPTLHRTLGGERFAAGLAARRAREEKALVAVAAARVGVESLGPSAAALRERWSTMTLDDKRAVIVSRLDCAFVMRGNGPAPDRMWAIPKGAQPPGLPPRAPQEIPPTIAFTPGRDQVRALPAAGTLDWSKRKVTLALGPFLGQREEWPHFSLFQAAGLGLAYANAQRHQTVVRWAAHFGVKPPVAHRVMTDWSEQRVRTELTAATSGLDRWPTTRQFIATGHGELRKAVLYFGGAQRWAEEMGLAMVFHQRNNETAWTETTMRDAVRELAAGQDEWPTRKQFKAAGLDSLYNSIAKMGARRQLADSLELFLPAGPRYRPATRWTEQAIKTELDALLTGRDWYPTSDEFRAAGLGGLFQRLRRRSGGHDAVARSYGLQRRGRAGSRRNSRAPGMAD